MKSITHIFLLFLWIFALVTPSIVTLLNNGDKAVMVMNLNEEEQQEQGKKDVCEEKIISPEPDHHSLTFFTGKNFLADNSVHGISNHAIEIPLPPPEHFI